MSVNSVGGTNPIHTVVNQPTQKPSAAETAQRPTITDKLDLSGTSGPSKPDGIRFDKVASIKAQIDNGTYETDEKLDIAIDRMLDKLL